MLVDETLSESARMRSEERKFSKSLRRARIVVERAFGLLKGRGKILLKEQDGQLVYNICNMMSAC